MYKVIGIDEAGKGPVIGSMFIGFSIINLESLKELNSYQNLLKELGVTDSKKLSSKKRKEIYFELKKKMDMKYVQLTPVVIDANFFSGGNLMELEIKGIVNVLETEKPDLIMIDALTSNPEKFGKIILQKLSFEPKIISENKADLKYEMVGAASIIAKELREQEVAQIKLNTSQFGDCGSGYPSDPKTKSFIEKNWNNEEISFIFRKSWKTYSNLAKNEQQKSLDKFGIKKD